MQMTSSMLKEQTFNWIEKNTLAEKEEFDEKLQEIQKICSPVMAKLHAGSNGRGPTVEEMD